MLFPGSFVVTNRAERVTSGDRSLRGSSLLDTRVSLGQ